MEFIVPYISYIIIAVFLALGAAAIISKIIDRLGKGPKVRKKEKYDGELQIFDSEKPVYRFVFYEEPEKFKNKTSMNIKIINLTKHYRQAPEDINNVNRK